jgi:hypothetical protein
LNVEFNKLLVPTPQIPVPQPATDLNGDGIPSILENLLMMELLKQIMITEVLDGLQEFSNHLVMRPMDSAKS